MAPTQSSPVEIPDYLKQQGMSQECRDVIASLPSQRTWLGQNFHFYQGFWYATRVMEAVLSFQKLFQAQDADVLLATSLKSGTTWTKALIFALMNRGKYVNTRNHPLLENNPHALILTMEFNVYGGGEPVDLSNMESPRLLSTHLPFISLPESVRESSNCKIVYMGRNPKDTLISLWKFMNKLKNQSMDSTTLEVAFDEFCKGETPFGPVWEHALDYWKQSLERPEKVMFLKFEDMKENPRIHVSKLAEFLGCPFSPEEERQGVVNDLLTLCSFEHLSQLEVNQSGKLEKGFQNNSFFRKGEVGDWENYLTPEMTEEIDRITENKLKGSGLKL